MMAIPQAPAPVWSSEKPTTPGWYWYRCPHWLDLDPVIVNVVIIPQTGKLTILWTATNQAVKDYLGTGEWSGPIQPPKEGDAHDRG